MKAKRHAYILEILKNEPVETQEDLLLCLREGGFSVTQATVSRDIKELRLVKALDSDGRYRYAVPQQDTGAIATKFYSLFADAVLQVDFACNIVVVKCLPGMAQATCAAMDSLNWASVVGTLAGDDTFLCVTKTPEQAIEMTGELKKLAQGMRKTDESL